MTERIRWSYEGSIEKLRALSEVWDGFERRVYVPFSARHNYEPLTWFRVGRGPSGVTVEEGDYIERDKNGAYSVVKNGEGVNETHPYGVGWYKCPGCKVCYHESYQGYETFEGEKYCEACADWEDTYVVIDDVFKCRKCGHAEAWESDECPDECPKCEGE